MFRWCRDACDAVSRCETPPPPYRAALLHDTHEDTETTLDELRARCTQRAELFSNLNWFIGEKQELRVKLQAIAIGASARQARRLLPGGNLIDSDAPLGDFQLRNLGFQDRYRYSLDRLSDIYAVYGRGGFALDDEQRGLNDTLTDVFSLKDDHQLLLKIAYRFEL